MTSTQCCQLAQPGGEAGSTRELCPSPSPQNMGAPLDAAALVYPKSLEAFLQSTLGPETHLKRLRGDKMTALLWSC